jgi:hypothetical protein
MACGHMLAGGTAVNLLIIEEDIGAERLEKIPFTEPTEKQAFVYSNAPLAQCSHNALMSWGGSRSDKGGSNRTFIYGKFSLQ